MFETAIGQDAMSGTCTGGPILPAYGLVVITPRSGSLTWDDQEPGQYTFSRTGPDAYYFAGPTGNGDGSVTLTLQFTAEDRLVMQRVFTPTADPACQHTHNYTGDFQWLMP
jgi:hypothetical protein